MGWSVLEKIVINYKVLQSSMEAMQLGREAEVKSCDFNAIDKPQTLGLSAILSQSQEPHCKMNGFN